MNPEDQHLHHYPKLYKGSVQEERLQWIASIGVFVLWLSEWFFAALSLQR